MGVETLFFAIVAFLVLGRLFQVLGQNHGAPPPITKDFGSESGVEGAGPLNRTALGINETENNDPLEKFAKKESLWFGEERFAKISSEIETIQSFEKDFDPYKFEKTAALAFEAIVGAFGKGDEASLKNLTSEKVFNAYQEGIQNRQANNKGAIDIIKLSDPKIKTIEIQSEKNNNVASIDIEFSATLSGVGEKIRNTNEIWTFEKKLGDKNPIWRLCAVHSV